MRPQISLFLVFWVVMSGPLGAQDPVHFPCPNLKAAVEEKLWLYDPTPADMLGLNSISSVKGEISDLTGLEYAKNLQTINFHLNLITDVSPLSKLNNLQKLSLGRNQILDLSPLADLTGLRHLDLHGNQLSDISALSGLANLDTLLLRWNRIRSISSLSGLTNLTYVTLHNNQISDISALAGLTKLTTLYLYNNQISDISALSGLVNLELLSLPDNQIPDISAMSGLTKLSELYLQNNQISDISALSGLANLTMLWLHDNPLNQQACDTYIPQIMANNPGFAEFRYDACALQYGLTISSGSGGSVSTPGEGAVWYDQEMAVPVTATAQSDHRFAHWTGSAVTAGKLENPGVASTTVTVDGHYTLRANFANDQPGHPAVNTDEAGNVTDSSARLAGYLVDHGEETCEAWFCYWVKGSQAPTKLNTSRQGPLQASQPYVQEVTGLLPGTTYCFQAVAENANGSDEGDARIFTTLEKTIPPARLIHVDDDAGSDPGPYDSSISDPQEDGTEVRPYDCIQEAIELAQDLDRILVHEGTYYETLNLMGKRIEIRRYIHSSSVISTYPVIDAQDAGPVVTCNQGEGPDCVLSGLILTGGRHTYSAAIACIGASPTIKNCLIVGNHSTDPLGAIVNCQDSHSLFQNITVSDNTGAGDGSLFRFTDCAVAITNSILWDNKPSEITVVSGHDPAILYSDVQGSWPGPGNMTADPLFALARHGAGPNAGMPPDDYHILSETGRWRPDGAGWVADTFSSPCLDAGDPGDSWVDEPRPHGSRINMGAYGGTDQASSSLHVTPIVARWTFDESSGAVASDAIGNQHGVVYGATRTDGVLDGALQFDGEDDYVDCGNDPVLAPDLFTLSMWIYAQATSASRTVLSKSGGDKDRDYELELFSARYPTFSFGNGSQSIVLYSTSRIPLDEWTQITLTRDETEATMYINGSPWVSKTFDFSPSATDHSLIIGGDSLQPFRGKIDDVCIYDAVLLAREIAGLTVEAHKVKNAWP